MDIRLFCGMACGIIGAALALFNIGLCLFMLITGRE